jgi:hypothetical protein
MIVTLFVCAPAGLAVDAIGQTDATRAVKVAVPSAPPTESDQRPRFTGTYHYAGNKEEEKARLAAIDRAVEGMSFVIRSAARSRISATTQILGLYSFSFEAGKIRVHAQSRPDMISGENGEAADYVYNGKRSELTQRHVGDRIFQGFASDDGRRENEFRLSEDGQMLTLKVTLTSPRLSVPVVYSLSYKKAD